MPTIQMIAFIYGKDLTDIAITGEGVIDGVDCYNPKEKKALEALIASG